MNWQAEGIAIERLIRGMSPYPTAWANLQQQGETIAIKIYNALYKTAVHNEAIGKVIVEKKQLFVAVKDGFIELLELQLPAKKRMKTADLLNGFSFDQEAKMI